MNARRLLAAIAAVIPAVLLSAASPSAASAAPRAATAVPASAPAARGLLRPSRRHGGRGGFGPGLGFYSNDGDYSDTDLHLDGFAGDGEHGAYLHPVGRFDWANRTPQALRGGGFACRPYSGPRPGIHTVCVRS